MLVILSSMQHYKSNANGEIAVVDVLGGCRRRLRRVARVRRVYDRLILRRTYGGAHRLVDFNHLTRSLSATSSHPSLHLHRKEM